MSDITTYHTQTESNELHKLKRCPFCGSAKVSVRFYNQPSVVCHECLCMGPAAQRLQQDNKDQCEREAVLRWNKRVDYSHAVTLEAQVDITPLTARDIATDLKKTMQCNCDLDNWEPEDSTGHSLVCNIHKLATRIYMCRK